MVNVWSTVGSKVLKSDPCFTLTKADIDPFFNIASPDGVVYIIYNTTGRVLYPFSSCFFSLISVPFYVADQAALVTSLTTVWTTYLSGWILSSCVFY